MNYLERLEQAAANPLDPFHDGPHYWGCGHAEGDPTEPPASHADPRFVTVIYR
jgi:hypothetical protein